MKNILKRFSVIRNNRGTSKVRRHPYLSMAVSSVFFFFIAVGGLVVVNASTLGPEDVHVVDIFEDGNVRSIPTRAKTVGDLLDRLEIPLEQHDRVEPQAETPITEDNFQVAVFRASPVSITDQGETNRYLSAFQDPRLIANDLGYELHAEDIASWVDTDGSTTIARSINISRAKTYTINLYGNPFEVRSQSGDLGEILSAAGIVLNEGDTLTPTNPEVTDGDKITIARYGTRIETVEESIPFDTIDTNDPTLTVGSYETTKAGVAGAKTVTYEIELENDVEIGRKVIQEVVTTEPVARERLKGTKAPVVSANVSGDKEFLMAAAGIAESDWGYVDYILSRESGWNHLIYNRAGSGAYGLCQALPGSKMASAGADWRTNPVTQLRWCNGYAVGRYGSWANAYSFWIANHWW